MTVSTTGNRAEYSLNATTASFAFASGGVNFTVLSEDDLKVYVNGVLKEKTTHYTVSINSSNEGTVTFVSSPTDYRPTSGQTVVIVREVPLTQNTNYQNNNIFDAETLEKSLDYETMKSQQTSVKTDRAIKFSDTATGITSDVTEITAPATSRANKLISFDADGDIQVTQEIGTYLGNWATATVYVQRDLVKQSSSNDGSTKDNVYICIQAHTSTGTHLTQNDSAKWALILDVATASGGVTESSDWARKVDGIVIATAGGNDYSSKAYAIGGSGVDDGSGSAKDWASKASGNVGDTSTKSAKQYAEDASTSASTATTQASTATTKASEASTSESNALTYRNEAQTAKTSAETALDSFDDRYLGSKTVSSHPSLDNDGSSLLTGALYYNTGSGSISTGMYVYSGSAWESLESSVGGNTVTSTSGNNLNLVTPSNSNKVVINSGDKTIQLPNVRASSNNYVLAMDNISTGTTAWQATAVAPTINSISGALNHDQDSTLTLFGEDFKADTTVSLWGASSGGSQVGGLATITNQTATRLEATFGHGALNVGATLYVEAENAGITTRFATAFVVSADPTVTFTQGTGSGANTTNHLGTYGGRVAGGPQDSNTKLLLNFDRGGGTDIEDSSNTGGIGHKVTASGHASIKASPFGDGKSALYFDGSTDNLAIADSNDFDFGTGAFTIEFWFYPTSTTSDQNLIHRVVGTAADNQFNIIWMPGGSNNIIVNSGTAAKHTGGTGLTLNAWSHIAICRDGSNQLDIYINGVKSGSTYPTSWDINSSDALHVMVGASNGGSGGTGYLDEIRIVKGVAVYTSDFTVPTSRLSATQSNQGTNIADITGTATKLLIHSNSAGTFTATNGVVRASETTARNSTSASNWDSKAYYYSNTQRDYLTAESGNLNIGNKKFTLEGWFKFDTSEFSWSTIYKMGGTSADNGSDTGVSILFGSSADGNLAFEFNNADTYQTFTPSGFSGTSAQPWYHIVLERQSTSSTDGHLWVNGTKLSNITLPASINNPSTNNVNVGKVSGDFSNSDVNFFIDDLHLVVGSNVYGNSSGTITPPTSKIIPVADTKFLYGLNNTTFTDSSPTTGGRSVHDITPTGAYHSQGHGGIAPAMTWPASGKLTGSAGVYFDGDGDWLTIDADKHGLQSESDYTLEFWVYPKNDNSTYYGLFDTRFPSGGDGLWVYLGDGTGGNEPKITVNVINATITSEDGHHPQFNEWSHIVICRNGDSGYMYVNGKYAGTATWTANSTTQNTFIDATVKLRIGSYGDTGNSHPFYGYLDGIRIAHTDLTRDSSSSLYTGSSRGTSTSSNNFTSGLPTQIYGAYKDKTIPTITFTGQLATNPATGNPWPLADDEDIEFSNVANTSNPSGMQKLDDTNIGLTLTNLTSTDKNKATLTGTISDDFSGTTRANLPVKAQVRTERGNAAYDSTGASPRLVTFSSSTNTEGLQPGYTVTGVGSSNGIQDGTTIASIDSATTLTLSQDTNGGALTDKTLHFGDPERVAIVNGGTTSDETDAVVMGTSDPMLTIAVDSETQPKLFNARRYNGDEVDGRVISGFTFSPDLLWIKSRNTSDRHILFDSVRGVNEAQGNILTPSDNYMQSRSNMLYGHVKAFTSDGFSVEEGDSGWNQISMNDQNYIAWAWKAGGPSVSISNTGNATNITQSASVNSGLSITKFNGHASGVTFPHNLGDAPEFIIVKDLESDARSWVVDHKNLANSNGYLVLSDNADEATISGGFGASDGTNIVLGADGSFGGSTNSYICYAWTPVAGVSAFGTHTGQIDTSAYNTGVSNAVVGANGYCGFKPRWLMIKCISDDSTSWFVVDAFRGEASAGQMYYFESHANGSESSDTNLTAVFKDNGFTTGTHASVGGSGKTYISIAFA